MMNKIKNKKAFTLVEIIFSVAFLCVVSVIILRLFVASYEIEGKTDTVDMATLHMINEIETLKSLTYLEADQERIEVYYDDSWQLSKQADASFQVLVVVLKNNMYGRGLYDFKASVIDLKTKESVVFLETMHYYNHKE